MTESEFIAIAKRPPNEFERRMNGIDQPTAQQMQRELEADVWPWPMSQDAQRLHDGIERFAKRQTDATRDGFRKAHDDFMKQFR